MPYDRPSWDLTSVLYAACPDSGYFNLSPSGTATVDESGIVLFEASPAGRHRYLTVNRQQMIRLKSLFTTLCSWPNNGQAIVAKDPIKIVCREASMQRIAETTASTVED
jgi:hypothetical protein